MYDPTKTAVPISTTTGTQQRPTRTFEKREIPIQKFWEELQLNATIQTLLWLAPDPENYPTSLIDNNKKPWGELGKHKAQRIEGEKTVYPSIVCTAGTEIHNKKECVGCYQQEHFVGKPNPWKVSTTTKHQVIHFAFYHKVPRLKDGQPVVFQDKQQFNSELCKGGNCRHCEANVEKVFGKLLKLELGPNHTKNLLGGEGYDPATKTRKFYRGIRHQLNWTCGGCGGTIVTKAALCSGCGDILEDFTKLVGADPKDMLGSLRGAIENKLASNYTCKKCGVYGLPVEASDCCYDVEGKMKLKKLKCTFEAPERMDLYNSVLQINKEGAATESALKLKGQFSVNESSNNPYQFEVDEPFIEIVNRAIGENGGLYNLDKEIAEFLLSPEVQAKILSVPNPFTSHRLPSVEDAPAERPKYAGGVVVPTR
jgi:hypothetical protein